MTKVNTKKCNTLNAYAPNNRASMFEAKMNGNARSK